MGKGPSGFEDNRTSRLKSLSQEHPMPFPPSLSSSNSTRMPLYPWWQHQGRATRGWSWWSAAQVSYCPGHGVSRKFEAWYKSGGIFLLHSAVPHYWPPTMQSCPKRLSPLNRLVRTRNSHGQAITEWSEKHKDEIKEPLLAEWGEIYGSQTIWMPSRMCSQTRNLAHTVAMSRHLKLSTIPF